MTPYSLVSSVAPVAQATKRELLAMTRQLEAAALQDPPAAAGASLQDVRYLTDRTRAVYASLARTGAPTRLHARGLQAWLAPGVAGVALDDEDPLVDEWVVVLSGHQPVVFAATNLPTPDCDEDDRCFTWAMSRDPEVVDRCAELLGLPASD